MPRIGEFELLVVLAQDTRYALRTVRKDLRFFLFGMLIVGLGVGASTAIFSILSPLLIRPLSFHHSERLVWIANSRDGGGMSAVTSRTSNLRDFRQYTQSFDGLAGYDAFFEQASYNLLGQGEPERLIGVSVTRNFIEVLGLSPYLGQNFTDDQEGPWHGASPVLLTHAFWHHRFAANEDIVGTAISLNNLPCEVVGVLPPTFDFASTFAPHTRVDFLRLFPINDETDRWGNTTSIIGRLRPDATLAQAQADIDAVLQRLTEAEPDRWGLGGYVTGLRQHIAGPYRSSLILLAAGAIVVVLIVCVNLSNLLLAKGSQRRNEMAVRSALGASRGRLVRQLMIESLVMAGGGATLGIVLAAVATRAVASSTSIEIPMLRQVSIDGYALLFSGVAALVCGLLVGLVPALRVSGGQVANAIRGSGRRSSANRRSTVFREILVVAEVALACVLLVFGGLLLKSFQRVLDVDLGFEPAHAVTWQLNTTREFDTLAETNAFFRQMIYDIETIPGVETAGLSDAVPLGRNRTWGVRVPGVFYERNTQPSVFPHIVDHQYIPTMQIPLLAGRHFTLHDTVDRVPVVILNETAAGVLFPQQDPIGKTILNGDLEIEVIGVVADVRHRALETEAGSEMYLPMTQNGDFRTLDLVVRSHLPVASLVPAVSAALHRTAPGMPTREFRSLEGIVDLAISPRRFTVSLLALFAGIALVLSALGIYAVLSYSVSQRIPEIGIRMALGESAGGVLRRIVGRTLTLATIGVVIGALGSLVVSRLVESLLFGVEATDPLTFVGMSSLLLVVSALAGLQPALRAARTDSITALQRS